MSEYKAFNMSIEASLDKTRVPSQESIMPAAQMETDALDLPIGDCKEVLAVENCNGNWKIDKYFQSMDEVTSFSSGNGESQKPLLEDETECRSSESGLSSLQRRIARNSLAEKPAMISFLETTDDVDRIETFLEMFLSMDHSSIEGAFKTAFTNFSLTIHPMKNWRDQFGMTLLMKMTISMLENTKQNLLRQLVEKIIREEYFDDSYLSHRADYDPSLHFHLQHYQGVHKVLFYVLFNN